MVQQCYLGADSEIRTLVRGAALNDDLSPCEVAPRIQMGV